MSRSRRGEDCEGRADEPHRMHPHHLHARGRQAAGGGRRGGIPLRHGGGPAESLLDKPVDEALAGMADEDRRAEIAELSRAGHERLIVGVGLAEADAGVEADPLERNAGGEEDIPTTGQVGVDFHDDVAVAGIELHRAGCALHVHRTDTSPRVASYREHGGVSCQARHIIDDFGPDLDRSGRHFPLRGIDRNGHPRLGRQPPDHFDDPPEFLSCWHRLGKWPRALAADIEQIRPGSDECQAVGYPRLNISMPTAIRKAVGGDVHDPHHQWPLESPAWIHHLQLPSPQLPVSGDRRVTHGIIVTRLVGRIESENWTSPE